jgi:CDP-paratose synthetase
MMVTGNICITGTTGFIGENLVKSLRNLGYSSITGIARSKESSEKINGLNIECYLDDGDTEHLTRLFKERNFDTVIHLASLYLKNHQSKQIEDLVISNVLFGTRLLEASVKSTVKHFINTGTFWQHYENKPYSPVNLYAATKQAFEVISQYYRETSSLFFTTLYLNDTYGPGDTRKKILNIWSSMKDSDVLDMSPGAQKINLLHIDDVVDGYIKLIELVQNGNLSKDSSSSFVLKGKEDLTLRQLSVLFERIAGKKLIINWGGLQYKNREVMSVWDRGMVVPGWAPRVSIDEGLKQFIMLTQSQ